MIDCIEIFGVVRHTYPRASVIVDVRLSAAEMTDEVAWHSQTSFLGGHAYLSSSQSIINRRLSGLEFPQTDIGEVHSCVLGWFSMFSKGATC